jgi:hypothetical protein
MNPGESVDAYSRGVEAVDTDDVHQAAAIRLRRVFERHLAREAFADCSRVLVHESDAGRYEYVDGVHYVTGVDEQARERVEAFVANRNLDVVMDGYAGVAFEHGGPAVDADVHVAGAVVRAAFDATYADLDDVIEVVDRATEVSWTELDGQPT